LAHAKCTKTNVPALLHVGGTTGLVWCIDKLFFAVGPTNPNGANVMCTSTLQTDIIA